MTNNTRMWLKQARLDKNLSQRQLAEKVGCTRNFISMLESGVKDPSLETVSKLVAVLNIEVSRFLPVQQS